MVKMQPSELAKLIKRSQVAHPSRLAIMLILVFRRRVQFTELQHTLDMTPGNLWSHIEKLEAQGYVKRKRMLVPFRYVTVVEATEKGVRETLKLLEALSNFTSMLQKVEEEGS